MQKHFEEWYPKEGCGVLVVIKGDLKWFPCDNVATNEDDFVIENAKATILIDGMSMQYLQGARIDYKEEIMGSQFVIVNPNAQSTCGCGSSFSV